MQTFKEAIAKYNKNPEEVLRAFEETTKDKPIGFKNALINLVCQGKFIMYLDSQKKLIVKNPAQLN